MIWSYEESGYLGLIIGFANDGIAGVPGVLRVTVESEDGKVLKSGCLDPGYPLPGKLRQAQFVLANEQLHHGLATEPLIEALLNADLTASDPLSLPLPDEGRRLLAAVASKTQKAVMLRAYIGSDRPRSVRGGRALC